MQTSSVAPGNTVDILITFGAEDLLEQLYFLILSRPPSAAERREFGPLLQNTEDARSACLDLAFALLASREFSSIR